MIFIFLYLIGATLTAIATGFAQMVALLVPRNASLERRLSDNRNLAIQIGLYRR